MNNPIITFVYYQAEAKKTAIYKKKYKLIYPVLGLVGEAGEVANKVKKIFRDQDGKITEDQKISLTNELGDVLWYLADISSNLGLDLSRIAEDNLLKLRDRKKRCKLQGSGDNR